MEHVQPLSRSFAWRGIALAVALVLVIVLAGAGGVYLVHRLEGTRPVSDTGHGQKRHAATAATTFAIPLRSRSRVSVLVLNGNGLNGAAGIVATRLLARHYRHAVAADAPNHAYARSVVLFRPGWQREAVRLEKDAHAAAVTPLDARLPAADAGYQLVLILGRN